jgi:hypothetical protein
MVGNMTYKIVNDSRKPILIKHSEICSPLPNDLLIDDVDTSYPGIVIKYENGYLIEDGVHRMAKLQKQGIFESLFYVVSIEEYRNGMVSMKYRETFITLGAWNHNFLSPRPHK